MFFLDNYAVAVCFCVVTMLCWGSWANTSKIATERWPFPLFYWDYSLGLLIASLLYGFTMGSSGSGGRGFIADLLQADTGALLIAFLGGVVFNISNLLVVAAMAVAGLAVAFPVGVGLALVIGVILNYVRQPQGNPLLLFGGVCLVVVAMGLTALASSKASRSGGSAPVKGILLAIVGGVIMGFFYRLVAGGMTLNFVRPEAGMLTPYSAVFVFSAGVFLSNFVWNTFFMYRPVIGARCAYPDYLNNGTLRLHLIGLLGGLIFNTGFLFNLIASDKAGPAISYGLGQGSTMVGAAWGVFVFKEFKGAPASYIASMFVTFILGLGLIVIARL